MPILNIEALDTLFFRDGRPFSMGEDNYADNVMVIPMPSVFYGAIASSYISDELQKNTNIALSEAVKKSNQLAITGFRLRIKNAYYLPMPKDLVVYENAKNKGVVRLVRTPAPTQQSNYQLDSILMPPSKGDDKIDNSPRLIKDALLSDYLYNELKEDDCPTIQLSDMYCFEPKIGIGRNNITHTVKDGLLYRTNMVRMSKNGTNRLPTNDNTLSFAIEQNLLEKATVLQLGGEKRVATAQLAAIPSFSMWFPEIQPDTMFKIYLATPAIFKAGWRPDEFLNKYNLELIAAATDKPIHVGGWDLDKKCPKPMRLAVSAGSVYYVQAQKGKENKVAEAIQFIKENKSISELDTAKQGFGLAFVGKI